MLPKSSGVQRRIFRKGKISFIQEIFVLYFGIRDPRTPFHAKLIAWAALAYLLSPIDLIPDFIPVAGYLDDLVIVPLLLHAAFRNSTPCEIAWLCARRLLRPDRGRRTDRSRAAHFLRSGSILL